MKLEYAFYSRTEMPRQERINSGLVTEWYSLVITPFIIETTVFLWL